MEIMNEMMEVVLRLRWLRCEWMVEVIEMWLSLWFSVNVMFLKWVEVNGGTLALWPSAATTAPVSCLSRWTNWRVVLHLGRKLKSAKQSVKALQMVWLCRPSNMLGHLHHFQDSHHWEYWCCFVAVGARPLEHHCSYDISKKSPCTSGMTPCCIPKHDWLHVGKHSLIVTPYCLFAWEDNMVWRWEVMVTISISHAHNLIA